MEHNMTSGNITRQLFGFSLPIIMGNIFQQLYNTADAVIVGKMIGNDAFAAVSVANPIMSVVLFFLVGLSMGVGVLLSQRFGAQDMKAFKVQYSTALIAGSAFTILVSAVCILLSKAMLKAANTPEEILYDTDRYLKMIFLGMIGSFFYNYFASALRSIGDSRTAFIILVISTIVNVFLDIGMIRYTSMGVLAAAAATVISQVLSAALCLIYIYRKVPLLALKREEFVFEKNVLKNTILFSWASAFQQTFLYFGRLLVQGTINAHGTDMITGYNAAIRLEAFIMAFIDGTGSSIATFAGQNLGAGRTDRLKKGLIQSIQLNLVFIALWDVCLLTLPEQLVGLYVDLENVQAAEIGIAYITSMPVFYCFCGCTSAMQGFFRGIGKVKIAMAGTFSQIIIRCILAVLFVPRYGIYGVCISVVAGWILLLIYDGYLSVRYFKGIQAI